MKNQQKVWRCTAMQWSHAVRVMKSGSEGNQPQRKTYGIRTQNKPQKTATRIRVRVRIKAGTRNGSGQQCTSNQTKETEEANAEGVTAHMLTNQNAGRR